VLQLLTADPICDAAEARRAALANWFILPWLFSRLPHKKNRPQRQPSRALRQ
jgi:hypothetical protein